METDTLAGAPRWLPSEAGSPPGSILFGALYYFAGCQTVLSRWVVVCLLLRLLPALPHVIWELLEPFGAGLAFITA